MKELLILPIIFSLIVGLSIELTEIAESSSDKVLRYTEAMEDGIDCAFRGELILECSPELANMNFQEDMDGLNNTLTDFETDIEELYDQLNETQKEELENNLEGFEDLIRT